MFLVDQQTTNETDLPRARLTHFGCHPVRTSRHGWPAVKPRDVDQAELFLDIVSRTPLTESERNRVIVMRGRILQLAEREEEAFVLWDKVRKGHDQRNVVRATLASVACCSPDRPVNACMMPHTVPNRPTYGLTDPAEARKDKCASRASISRW